MSRRASCAGLRSRPSRPEPMRPRSWPSRSGPSLGVTHLSRPRSGTSRSTSTWTCSTAWVTRPRWVGA
eukprot:15134220-Heterocapsa_arctica.AAC.1